jgi:uncharacterized protein (TIGR03437 family)
MRLLTKTLVAVTFGACLLVPAAPAAIQLTWFPASDYNANTSAMDATLGTTGDVIETFETTTLMQGLSITLSGGVPTATWTSLPNLYKAPLSCGVGIWDGVAAVTNSVTNLLDSCGQTTGFAALTTFNYAPGTAQFGISLSNFQSHSSPQYPITNHELFVNGVDMGTIETLAGSNWSPGIVRNAYLVVTATGGSSITSVGFENLTATEFLVFDHLAVRGPASQAPSITQNGVVPVYSSSPSIQPGSWISIYGTNLATATTVWNGDFPQTLGGASVTVNSRPAYLWFVSPTQINLQAPDDTATGTVDVVVTTAVGSATSTVTLDPYAPSFSLYNSRYVAAIVATPGEPGNGGNGYDYIGPGGTALPFTSRPVKAGETVLLYGVGFGPTTPTVPAGAAYSGAASVPVLPTVTIGGVQATVTFAGIVEAGLFQLNVVVPDAGSGDRVLLASIGGVTTPADVLITLQ